MRRLLHSLNLTIRYITCRLFGHVKAHMHLNSVGLLVCRRCLRITDQKTARARITHGEIEQRMQAHPPEGYSFVDCNWKKRKAKFASPAGKLKFIGF